MKDHPGWKFADLSEWLNQGPRGTEWADPHIRLITINTTVGKENELLVGELGSLAQAIFYRLHQPEFQNTSFFPVCI